MHSVQDWRWKSDRGAETRNILLVKWREQRAVQFRTTCTSVTVLQIKWWAGSTWGSGRGRWSACRELLLKERILGSSLELVVLLWDNRVWRDQCRILRSVWSCRYESKRFLLLLLEERGGAHWGRWLMRAHREHRLLVLKLERKERRWEKTRGASEKGLLLLHLCLSKWIRMRKLRLLLLLRLETRLRKLLEIQLWLVLIRLLLLKQCPLRILE